MFRTALVLCASLIAAAPLAAAEPRQPNIVFVLIDDLGYGDLGVYGNPDVKTPHIDRLAAGGTRFTQFTVGSPVCSASRVALTTGQFPARHRIHSFLASRQRNRERGMADFLDPKAPSIARAFKAAGYATAHFGKWHMGGGRDVDDAPLPQAYGFDESLVSFEGLGDRVLPPGRLSEQSAQLGRGRITRAPKHKLTEIYVDRAIGFLREHQSEPVYLHLWLNDVHDPFAPTDEQLEKFEGLKESDGNRYRQQYYAVLDEVDRQVGRLAKAIDEMGLGERTLFVLSGDNGPTAWPHYAKEGLDAPGRTGGLRGRKWSLYEGGIREPLIVRWSGRVKAGHVDEATIISAVDLFPTFCRLAGVEPPPPDVEFDGVDMSRAFLGEAVERERPLFWEYGRDATYLRPAEPIDVSPNLAIREGRWKLLMNADGSRLELYDLGKSPKEYFNVAGRHPDVRDRLAEKLLAWKDTLPSYPAGAATRLGKPETVALKAGQSLPTSRAPQTAEAEITVEAVVTADGKDGVIVAHGGQAAGYALTIEDGKAQWTVRTRGEAFSVTSPGPLPAGKVSLKAKLAADGTLTLTVGDDDAQPARGKASQLLPAPPVDPLDVGFDGRGNVGTYKDDFRFGGTIHEVSVTTRPVERDVFGHMVTRWAGDVDPSCPLPEYPRPQMKRERWQNLNGHWQYAIRPKDEGRPEAWDGRILVPFPVESLLSGVQKRVGEANRLWYRRTFQVPDDWNGDRLLLHFGAVDWESDVWVNGKHVGRHRGGYDPFSFDVTDALSDSGEQELVVSVWDPSDAGPQPRGKQVRDPQGIWYTPVTGIWQTAWIEPVPQIHIESVRIQTFLDAGEVDVDLFLSGREPRTQTRVEIRDADGKQVHAATISEDGFSVRLAKPRPWSPEDPHLYTLRVELASGDTIQSYFGMREVALQKDAAGHERLLLNGEPVFHLGPLDQGWWPDGLYTAPTDEALRFDIEMTKRYGFNMARKHVKVEPARWYYWADRLGLLVWQDMPSGMQGGGRGPNHVMKGQPDLELPEEAKQIFRTELKAMIDALHNHPSIVAWVPFNEGWGQHDTNEILQWTKDYDPTRLVDGPSGWEDRGYGEMIDLHRYPGPDIPQATEGRAAVLGEFGGLGLPVRGHTWVTRNNWGYRTYDSREALHRAYRELFEQLPALIDRGLAAAIYTQTTDVEVEVNGLMTYDRSVYKFDPDEFRELHEKVIEHGSMSAKR